MIDASDIGFGGELVQEDEVKLNKYKQRYPMEKERLVLISSLQHFEVHVCKFWPVAGRGPYSS